MLGSITPSTESSDTYTCKPTTIVITVIIHSLPLEVDWEWKILPTQRFRFCWTLTKTENCRKQEWVLTWVLTQHRRWNTKRKLKKKGRRESSVFLWKNYKNLNLPSLLCKSQGKNVKNVHFYTGNIQIQATLSRLQWDFVPFKGLYVTFFNSNTRREELY